jgi:activator of HSP90 ATPase
MPETETFTQKIILPTTAIDAYECFMDERKLASYTAMPAHIVAQEHTQFVAFDNLVMGEIILLERGKKIVKRWKADLPEWPSNHFSEVVLLFEDTINGCNATLIHSDVPTALITYMQAWWHRHCWEPLMYYLER